jgi:hypothetical protein
LKININELEKMSDVAIKVGTVFPAKIQVDHVRVLERTAPLQIAATRPNGNVVLTWPADIVCHLQVQTIL